MGPIPFISQFRVEIQNHSHTCISHTYFTPRIVTVSGPQTLPPQENELASCKQKRSSKINDALFTCTECWWSRRWRPLYMHGMLVVKTMMFWRHQHWLISMGRLCRPLDTSSRNMELMWGSSMNWKVSCCSWLKELCMAPSHPQGISPLLSMFVLQYIYTYDLAWCHVWPWPFVQ